ncbi:MAG TPA: FAD/NAD(P)-binding protein [Gammaproteobacteria bacterium]
MAYGTADPAHLLNTRAERMSLLGSDPTHFVRWNRARGRDTAPTDFVARSVYGDYSRTP